MQIKTVESLSHSSQNSYHRGNRKQILVRVEAWVGRRWEGICILLVRIQNCCTSGNQYGSSFFKKNYKWNYIIQLYHS